MFNKVRSFSGRDFNNSYALFVDFSFSTGNGSRDSASNALMNREYARFTRSSTCQYNKRFRSFGALEDTLSGCSLKYRSLRSGGNRLSRNNSVSAPTACTAPLLPPFTLAFSSKFNKCSKLFRFATGSSCANTVAAAILSAAVPEVRTNDNHLESAVPLLCDCFS